ncbi:MAG: cytochrome c [Cyanobacteria bacterium]|nr:cytochrome c [Cyanobacteriota bacterium]
MKKGFVGLLAVVTLTFTFLPTFANRTDKKMVSGGQIFSQYCASCHAGGGNRIKPNRPLAGSKELSALVRFKTYLSAPPGHMPYYQNIVNDKQTLQSLYKFCKSLKKPPKQAVGKSIPKPD